MPTVSVEDSWPDNYFNQRRDQESPEYDSRDGREHLLSCVSSSENQWKEPQDGGQSGHRHRNDSFEGSLDDNLLTQMSSFLGKTFVVIDEHDSVSGHYPHEGNKSYQVRGREYPST